MFRKIRYGLFKKYRKRIDLYQDILYTLYKKYKELPIDNSKDFTFLHHGGMCGNLTSELIKQTNPNPFNPLYCYSLKCKKDRKRFFKTIGFEQTDFNRFIKKSLPDCINFLSNYGGLTEYSSYWTWKFPVTGAQQRLFHPSDYIRMRKEYIKFLLNRLCDRHGI